MSDPSSTTGAARPQDDRRTVETAARREADSARAQAGEAGDAIRNDAAGVAEGVRRKAMEGVEQGKSAAASSLSDFTAAIRKASDELGERDQSMAAGLARQAASGLEQAADALKGQSVQDLTRSVADFARRQPTAFLVGAALAGVALGRFARASGDHAGPLGRDTAPGGGHDDWRRDGANRSQRPGERAGASSAFGGAARPPSQTGGADHASAFGRPGTSGSTDTSSLTRSNPAATSSQGDAAGGFRTPGTAPTTAALNQPGVSGSTDTSGLAGTTPSSTGDRR